MVVHYEGWNKLYDEFLSQNSNRIAPLGFFTTRNDIPKYVNNYRNEMMISYVIIGNNQNNSENDSDAENNNNNNNNNDNNHNNANKNNRM